MYKLNKLVRPQALSALKNSSIRSLTTTQLPSYLSKYPPVEVTTLPNGLRVATESGYGDSCSVALGIDVGSRVETTKNNGVAHFLEHLSFKGTDKRTRYELESSIENRGANFNAYTARDMTCYYLQVFKEDVDYAVEFISDVIFHSKYMASSVEEERNVILLESKSIFDNKYEFLFDLLHETAFPNSGLGLTTLGTTKNIQTLTRDDLVQFVNKYYTGSNLVLVGAGGIQHQQLVDAANKYMSSIKPTPSEELLKQPAQFVSDRKVYLDNDYPVAHIGIVNQSVGWKDPDSFPFMILHTIIDQYDSTMLSAPNPLTHEIAERHLCHNASNINICYKDTGLFGVYFECPKETVSEATENTITKEDVELAKKRFIFNILSNLDTSVSRVEDITRHLIFYGRRLTPAEIVARTNLITIDHIYNLIDKYIINKPLAVAGYGPVESLQSKEWFRQFSHQ